MPKIAYIDRKFNGSSAEIISLANGIIAEYQADGFALTLRQLYYQMVARDLIENNLRSYKRIGGILANARKAGLVDWNAIEDRTRNLQGVTHWDSPEQIMQAAINSYAIDKWENQPCRVEVWIEKDALVNVVERACRPLDVNYFSCRGYGSDSELWRAGYGRIAPALDCGQTPVIIHLGDHDPSGLDMTRDIVERVGLFAGADIEVNRIALNRDQVDLYKPPPNPAKMTDSRIGNYLKIHGRQSWELDALDPNVLVGTIQAAIMAYLDEDLWDEKVEEEEAGRARLREMMGR